MEAVGIERDRRIAELRGHHKDYCDIEPCPYGASSCDDCQFAKYRPYSTDISAAMELWDEMREAGAQPTLAVVQDFVCCDAWLNYGDDNADLVSNLGDDETDKSTEAGAISECYINWKLSHK